MFRRWPFFQRLLSWTKPHAPVQRGSRAYERYDWNSLLSEDPDCSGDPARAHGRHLVLPVAAGDGGQPRASRSGPGSTRPLRLPLDRDPSRRGRRTAIASRWRPPTGAIAAGRLVVAVGVAEPYTPPGVGMEHTHHYADVRPVESYADRRVLLIGKQNSGFELATGLLPWARQIVLASPSQARLSVDTRTLVGVRARYVQPYEDYVLGGGVSVLDAAIDRIERAADGALTVYLRRTDGGADLALEVDDAISATGFVCPLLDLPDLGVGTFGASRLPVQTPVVGERQRARASSSRGRSGRVRRASRSTACRRTPGPSTAPATTPGCWPAASPTSASGSSPTGRTSRRTRSPGFIATELAEAPELFHQRGYLARVLSADPAGGMRDDGVQPLTHVLDGGGPDALAATLEADGSGAIYPVVYTRIGGKVVEQVDRAGPADALRHGGRAHADRRPRAAGRRPLGDGGASPAVRPRTSGASDRRSQRTAAPRRRPASRSASGTRTGACSGRARGARRTTSRARPRRPDRG